MRTVSKLLWVQGLSLQRHFDASKRGLNLTVPLSKTLVLPLEKFQLSQERSWRAQTDGTFWFALFVYILLVLCSLLLWARSTLFYKMKGSGQRTHYVSSSNVHLCFEGVSHSPHGSICLMLCFCMSSVPRIYAWSSCQLTGICALEAKARRFSPVILVTLLNNSILDLPTPGLHNTPQPADSELE